MKIEINNGVICISRNHVYNCPLKLSDDYKHVMLYLFYNDFKFKTNNFFKIKYLRSLMLNVNDEISAGRIGANYGYVLFELKDRDSNIFLPEFFNHYQFIKTLNEIARKKDNNFSLYTEVNGYFDVFLKDVSAPIMYSFISDIYSDLCFDAETGFFDYSEERKAKAKKLMK